MSFILNDNSSVDLDLRPGIYNIRGGNGSGKTTLWKTLVGVNDDYENWKKEDVKYSGYMGGRSVMTADEVRAKKPEYMIEKAVKGMLDNNRLSRQLIRKLHVYAGPEHPHAAQKPEKVN